HLLSARERLARRQLASARDSSQRNASERGVRQPDRRYGSGQAMARLVRPLGSGRQLIAAAVAALLGLAHAAAQPAATYDGLLDESAAGDASIAIRSLAAWNQSAIAAASGSRARGMTAARQRVAVMLHTDTAYASLMARRDAMAAAHLAAARRVFSAMKTGVVDPRT